MEAKLHNAEDIECGRCGYDIQEDDVYVETVERIGEIYFHPYCPECNVYNDCYDITRTDWWVGE